MQQALYLLCGGLLGTAARFLIAEGIYQRFGTDFPIGTFLVNMVGCLLIGLFDTLLMAKTQLNASMRLFLMAGFCGAFTTFSTFILETSNLVKETEMFKALGYLLLSVILGFVLFRVGAYLGELL